MNHLVAGTIFVAALALGFAAIFAIVELALWIDVHFNLWSGAGFFILIIGVPGAIALYGAILFVVREARK
jgi:hypothetical protein